MILVEVIVSSKLGWELFTRVDIVVIGTLCNIVAYVSMLELCYHILHSNSKTLLCTVLRYL